MNYAEQARVAHDQLILNRIEQAIVALALEKGGLRARRLLSNPNPGKAAKLLAAGDAAWLDNDEALRSALLSVWRRL